MNDLFDTVKVLAIQKNKPNAQFMTPAFVFKNAEIIENTELNELGEANRETVADVTIQIEKSSNLRNYVDEVDKIKQEINKININADKISQLKNKMNLSVTSEEESELSSKLHELIQNTNSIIQLIKTEIKRLKGNFMQKSSEHLKIKRDIHQSLINIFKKALYNYQHVQNSYHVSVKDKMTRHLKIIYPNYLDEEVNEILNNADINTQSLVKWKMEGHEDLKNALNDVESKYRDVKTLEKSVLDLHQTIVELAALIEMNEEVIDNIQENVKDAQDFTEKANIDLVEAKKIQKKVSKWTIYITLAIFVVIVIVIIPPILKFV